MKAIKIVPENATAIETALQAVNGNAYTHTYVTYKDVESVALKGARRLDAMDLPKKARIGAAVTSTSGEEVARAYCRKGFSRVATRITVECRPTGWFLTNVEKAEIYQLAGGWSLRLTAEQDAEAVRRLRQRYTVISEVNS
jgi:hypothetical protein